MALKVTPPSLPVFINWKGLVPKPPKKGLGSFFWDKITGFLACLRSLVCFWPSFSKRDVTVLTASPQLARSSKTSPTLLPLEEQFKQELGRHARQLIRVLKSNKEVDKSKITLENSLNERVQKILKKNKIAQFSLGVKHPLFQRYFRSVWKPKIIKVDVKNGHYPAPRQFPE